MDTTAEERLASCRATRRRCAKALLRALIPWLDRTVDLTEADLRDRWLAELRREPTLEREGWYQPPPHGIGIRSGSDADRDGVYYRSLRPPEAWPSSTRLLDRATGMIYAYASPVDAATGIIGDFGITLYCGGDAGIRSHLVNTLGLTRAIASRARVGMTLGELYAAADSLIRAQGWTNDTTSLTDGGSVNIGHTIPGIAEPWAATDRDITANDAAARAQAISAARHFIRPGASTVAITPGSALTIEPRPGSAEVPMASYHTILLVHENRSLELLTDFADLFAATGMDYMMSPGAGA